jgi:hypothetical protein
MSPIRAMPAPAGATRFGNILFPGGTPSSHPIALGGTVSGSIPYTGVRPGGGFGRNRTVVVPYAIPVFAGGYGYGYGYAPQPVQQPNLTLVMPQQPTPTVIINNHYPAGAESPRTSVSVEEPSEQSGVKVYEATPRRTETAQSSPEPARGTGAYVRDDKPNIYLIALKDGTVRQAIGYWVKADLLHYVTPQAKIQEVAMAEVDRENSVRLNAERKLEFDLGIQ